VVSADDHLSVHHAFQTEAGGHVRHPHLSDPALQFKALRSVVLQSFAAGEAPLWNPTIYAGAPLLGDAQSMVGSPVTWLHLIFNADTAADASVLWLLLVVGLGSACLAGQLGASVWGRAIAGAGGMTAPFISVWLLHPHAATAVWLPWILLALERRSTWGTALATAAIAMGGHPQTALHIGLLTTAWFCLRIRWWKGLYWVGAGSLLAAPIWLPFIEEVSRSATLAAHGGNTLAPAQLLDLLWPGWHGHPAIETWSRREWSWADGRIHPGIGVAILALWSTRHTAGRVIVFIWLAAVIAAVTGLPGPVNHARLAGIAAGLLPIAAGLKINTRLAPFLFALVVSTGIWAGHHDQSSSPPEIHDPAPAPWTQRLREHVGDGRVIGLSWALQPNTGALVGLSDLRGYDLPVSQDTERLQMALSPRPIRPWFQIDALPSTSLLRFSAVRAVLLPSPGQGDLDIGSAPLSARRVEQSGPRAWKSTGARRVDSPEAGIELLKRDPTAAAHPPIEGSTGGLPETGQVVAVRNLKLGLRTVSFDVEGETAGIAVLADAWHPGWVVRVDGEPSQALRVGGVFRGVAVGSGPHQVTWRFEPWGWRWGWYFFWTGCAALIGPLSMAARRR
jgi:hypothetical protein